MHSRKLKAMLLISELSLLRKTVVRCPIYLWSMIWPADAMHERLWSCLHKILTLATWSQFGLRVSSVLLTH